MAKPQHDPLADRVGTPGRVPDADMTQPTPTDRRRDGALGGVLIVLLPVLILLAGLTMWWTNIGAEAPAVDPPVVTDTGATDG